MANINAKRSQAVESFRISEESFIRKLNIITRVYKQHFVGLLEELADPPLAQTDMTFIFYNTDIIKHSKTLIGILESYYQENSLCDLLENYFTDEDVIESFNKLILSSARSFECLSKKMRQRPDLCEELQTVQNKPGGNQSLGSLLGNILQRYHCYIPLIEKIQENTSVEHIDYSKFTGIKQILQNNIISFPVVSKVAISKLLQIENKLNRGQCIKLSFGDSTSNFHYELITEGVMWQISYRGDFEVREKCYLIILVRKIICIPFDKIETFKHTYVGSDVIDATSPDIKWSANLSECSFSSISSSSLPIKWENPGEVFVITETSLTNLEPYVLQEIRYLIPEENSPKDHIFWENSFSIAQSYSLSLEKQFADAITKQINDLETDKYETQLTEKQWKILAKKGQMKSYTKGDTILKQGTPFRKLYWITRGSATITKFTEDAVFTVGIIEKYHIFGELGYLTSSPTISNTLFANSSTVVYSIEYSRINSLFKKNISVSTSFFKLLCSQIVLHLMTEYSLEVCTKSLGNEFSRDELLEDYLINEKFQRTQKQQMEILKAVGLPPISHIVYGCSCQLITEKKKYKANVICLQDVLVIYCKSFGGSIRIVLNLSKLNNPEYNDKTLTISMLTSKDIHTLLFSDAEECKELKNKIDDLREQLTKMAGDKHSLILTPLEQPKIPILSEEEWYTLAAKAQIKKFTNGQVIIRQGDSIEYLYQIYAGTCDVYVERKTVKGSSFEVIESFECGDRFGESGFITPKLASTGSVVVTSNTLKVLIISKANIEEMFKKKPKTETGFYCYIAQQIAERFISRQNIVTSLRGSLSNNQSRKTIAKTSYIKWHTINFDDESKSELVASSLPGYSIEYGNFSVPQIDHAVKIEDIQDDYGIYETDFVPRSHVNLVGYSSMEEQFIAISICLKSYIEDIKFMILIRNEQDGYKLVRFVVPKTEQLSLNSHTTIPLLKHKVPELAHFHFYHVAIRHDDIKQDFLKYEQNEITKQYKFGLLYINKDAKTATESEYYSSNGISADLLEFMTTIGDLVELENWENFSGGLDCSGKNITGPLSLYINYDHFYEIMFHVAPLIPCEPNDEQLIGKKRHIGNDMVVLVFTESDIPFNPSDFKTQFNHTWIVVKKLPIDASGGSTRYKIEMICKDQVPFICRPILPSPPIFNKSELKKFLITKLINAERMVLKTKDFQFKVKRTRHHLLESYASKYAPHLKNPPKSASKSPRRKSLAKI